MTKISTPYAYVQSLITYLCVPEDVRLICCPQLRRTRELQLLHGRLYRWDLVHFSYKVVQLAQQDRTTYAWISLRMPPKGDDVVAKYLTPTFNTKEWLEFPYNDMFMIGRFEETHASRFKDDRLEGPYA